ncbi:hypothetical protein CHS0354_038458 [Potamilus streckersoni]|uniref:Uncharacterized protein n=1 Tax=Potamilus streckersoni TaxID=2493646 RepID=A0AAE0S5T8_9BIVA|nr:hypothetical protein CHS0354_038458 [Potamilus streckersoni]
MLVSIVYTQYNCIQLQENRPESVGSYVVCSTDSQQYVLLNIYVLRKDTIPTFTNRKFKKTYFDSFNTQQICKEQKIYIFCFNVNDYSKYLQLKMCVCQAILSCAYSKRFSSGHN